ncbi:protein argonaute 2-like [Lontra canadensis]|uniref:protein argonaute 2-like n=1 Tax=Lontra canadensis TaxID=76717 RepID=UPI0013F2E35B|nr:protein argonaute 2-like [Lontra canadensis]XP_032706379.1 protein argonaute 2-like [Lontra canadensis]
MGRRNCPLSIILLHPQPLGGSHHPAPQLGALRALPPYTTVFRRGREDGSLSLRPVRGGAAKVARGVRRVRHAGGPPRGGSGAGRRGGAGRPGALGGLAAPEAAVRGRRLPRRCSAAYFAHEFRGRGSVAGGRAAAAGARRGWSRSAPGSGRSERERGGRGLRGGTDAQIAGGTDTRARRAAVSRPHPLAPTPSPRCLRCMAQTFLPGRNTLSRAARASAFSSASSERC